MCSIVSYPHFAVEQISGAFSSCITETMLIEHWLPFPLLTSLLGFPVLCWIRIMSEHPYLVPDLRRRAFNLLPLNMDISCGIFMYGLYYIEVHSFLPKLLRVFIINVYWILSNAFSASIEMIVWFLFFILLMWYIIRLIFECWNILAPQE